MAASTAVEVRDSPRIRLALHIRHRVAPHSGKTEVLQDLDSPLNGPRDHLLTTAAPCPTGRCPAGAAFGNSSSIQRFGRYGV